MIQPQRLSDFPDWGYLLAEYYAAYRHRSAGGSKVIRSHMKLVRERLARCISSDPTLALSLPERKPVCAHLGRALDNGEQDAMRSMVKTIDKIKDDLTWRYGYDKLPRHLTNRYAYADIMSPHGPVICENLTLGIVLFAPRTTYPAHAHYGVTESYTCLSGATSENDMGVYVPGAMIINVPEHKHSITTSDAEPALLAYAWTGNPADLVDQKMEFKRRGGKNIH